MLLAIYIKPGVLLLIVSGMRLYMSHGESRYIFLPRMFPSS